MNIVTKFNVGDRVYFMKDNKVDSDLIDGVNIFIGSNKIPKIIYCLQNINGNPEQHLLFGTKEELLKSL